MARAMPVNKVQTRKRRKLTKREWREARTFYLLITPFIAGFLFLYLAPGLVALYTSFTQWNIIQPPQWTGAANYVTLFTNDPDYVQAIKVTALYAVLFLPASLILSLVLALMMNRQRPGINVFRAIYYMPSLLAGVSVGVLWIWIFDPQHGALDQILGLVGIPHIDWLNSTVWVVPAIVLTSLWGIGNIIVIYLAGLKGVPQPLYEAAEVDGAGWWARFWHVTIPLISPTIFYNLLTGLIGVFQIFDGPYVLTQGKGGPPFLSGNNILGSSEFYMIKLYRDAFANNLYGKASAEAVLLFVFIVLLTLVVLRTSRSWVYYEGNVVKGV